MEELTTAARQLREACKKHRATLSGHYSWEKTQQEAYARLYQDGSFITEPENYTYTPITHILSEKFDWSYAPSQEKKASLVTLPYTSTLLSTSIDHHAIILVNGALHEVTYGVNNHLPFEVMSFGKACLTYSQLLDDHFADYLATTLDPFALINTALFNQGIFIHIPNNTILTKPICIYHVTDNPTPNSNISYPRVLVVIGNNSQVSLINSWNSQTNQYTFTNSVTDIYVNANARLECYTLQTEGKRTHQVINTNFYQAIQSQVNSYTFTWEGELIRNNLSFHLQASYAQSNMYGLYYLSGLQHVDNQTTVDHRQPYTESNELYKGIVTDKATGVFNGKVYVQAEAQKTNAFQANNNILLSDEATIHTKPQLEIWADDVKCSHGATVGQLDEKQLFYLQSRGVPYDMSRKMLLHAFTDEIIEKVPLLTLRQYLQENFKTNLDKLG